MAGAGEDEPPMAEILASIRRIIDQSLTGLEDVADVAIKPSGPDVSGADIGPGLRGGTQHQHLSAAAENSAVAAFQALLASRFARHGDVIIGLTREMLRPMLKAWLDANLPAIVERLVSAEIEGLARGE